MPKAKLKKVARRVPKILSDPLYCYVEPGNGKHARTEGKKMFGSFSSYVNTLIAKDRGVQPHLGDWKAKGEAKKIRVAKAKPVKKVRKVKPGKKKSAGKKSPKLKTMLGKNKPRSTGSQRKTLKGKKVSIPKKSKQVLRSKKQLLPLPKSKGWGASQKYR